MRSRLLSPRMVQYVTRNFTGDTVDAYMGMPMHRATPVIEHRCGYPQAVEPPGDRRTFMGSEVYIATPGKNDHRRRLGVGDREEVETRAGGKQDALSLIGLRGGRW